MGHKDKRNLYLADEGLVLEDSGAAEGAAKSDLEKRVLARRDKKSKLKNPIFFVSPTRLSVRNLGRHVTDGKLKSMAAAAARAGVQAGRANPQDVRRYLEAQVRACSLARRLVGRKPMTFFCFSPVFLSKAGEEPALSFLFSFLNLFCVVIPLVVLGVIMM